MLTLVAKAISHWRRFGTGTVNQRIASAAVTIMAATVVVKVAAAVKDIVIAGHFGLGDALDALLIAMVLPSFVTAVIAYSFSGAFIPPYVRAREKEGPEAANALFANIVVISSVVLIACIAVMVAFAAPLMKLIAWQFSAEKLALARDLYWLLLPTVLIGGQITLWAAVLNADDKFALAALAPILSPLIIMAAIFLMVPGLDVEGVAWAIVIGMLAELALLGVALARRGLLPLPRWNATVVSHTRAVLKQFVPAVSAAVLMSGTTVIDNAMASWLGSGAVAALNYGNKIPAFVAAAGMTALGSAVLPHFSRLVALEDHRAIRHTLTTYARWLMIGAVPATLLLIATSHWIVRLLFERGAFTAEDTALVTFVQQMFLIQIPFVMVGMVGVRLLVALSQNHLLTLMAVVNMAVCVIGNLILMRWIGVGGIALATSIMYVVSCTMIWVLVQRCLAERERAPARESA